MEKTGKKTGFKKAGIVQWVNGHQGLDPWDQRRIIEDNERSVKNARDLGLPMDRNFGSFDDLAAMAAAVPEEYKSGGGLFIIRCPPRTMGDVKRKLFATWDQVVTFVNNLPGGYKQYRLGLREVTNPDWSGTIISSKGGDSVTIELWKGKHLEMDSGSDKTSFQGFYNDSPIHPRHFVWSANCTNEVKGMMLNALRYFAPNLRPTRSLFAEFSLVNNGYRFHGVSFDSYWTEIQAKKLVVTGD